MNHAPTTEERLWAILAHLSAVSWGMGILIPVVGWSDQRRKSSYGSFQCLQALGYQSLGFTVWALGSAVMIVLGAIVLLALYRPAPDPGPGLASAVPALLVITLGLQALYFLLPFLAAAACALGKDFRYPFMGQPLARYLDYSAHSEPEAGLNEEHEFRWVAAMGHFSIIIWFWGMLAPLAAWMLQGRHSPFLRFQSIQTVVFQGAAGLLALAAAVAGGLVLAVLGVVVGTGWMDPHIATGPILLALIFLGLLLPVLAVLLVVPLLHILGQWAGVRVLKGENYRYPWIGRLVASRAGTASPREEESH